MKITIHRGSHQIGGIATEISTQNARIIIDMGDELSLDPDFVSAPLKIAGVTDSDGQCDAVLFTHYHGDHMGQLKNIHQDIPLYSGAMAKDIMLKTAQHRRPADAAFCSRAGDIQVFSGGDTLTFGDMVITAYSIDHSACDSYMFLIEAEGKRLLYTGDFRMHGFRGKAMPKILRKIGKVDVLITEGTSLSRPSSKPMTERELQQKVKEYMSSYKYVYVMCSSTNLERICALSKAVPRGKYFLCDNYQKELIEIVEKHWAEYSPLYSNIKKTVFGDNILQKVKDKGFLMLVRDNRSFREIIKNFDEAEGIILYSMWDGYRTKQGSTIPDFLKLASEWDTLHTSGHCCHDDIRLMTEILQPDIIAPMHTDAPDEFKKLCPDKNVIVLNDGSALTI